jgi:hypothetical protein
MPLVRTRYNGTNIALLFASGVLCAFILFMTVMTAGFGADPVHDFKTGVIACTLYVSLLSVPSYLLMFGWSGIGSIAMWSVTALSFVLSLLAGFSSPCLAFVVFLAIQSALLQAIHARSERHQTELPA